MTSRSERKRWRWGYLCVFFASPIVLLPFVLLLSLGLGVDLHPKYGNFHVDDADAHRLRNG